MADALFILQIHGLVLIRLKIIPGPAPMEAGYLVQIKGGNKNERKCSNSGTAKCTG